MSTEIKRKRIKRYKYTRRYTKRKIVKKGKCDMIHLKQKGIRLHILYGINNNIIKHMNKKNVNCCLLKMVI